MHQYSSRLPLLKKLIKIGLSLPGLFLLLFPVENICLISKKIIFDDYKLLRTSDLPAIVSKIFSKLEKEEVLDVKFGEIDMRRHPGKLIIFLDKKNYNRRKRSCCFILLNGPFLIDHTPCPKKLVIQMFSNGKVKIFYFHFNRRLPPSIFVRMRQKQC